MNTMIADPIAGLLGGAAATSLSESIPALRPGRRFDVNAVVLGAGFGAGSGAIHAALVQRGRKLPAPAGILALTGASWGATTVHGLIADHRGPARPTIGTLVGHLVRGALIYGALQVADGLA